MESTTQSHQRTSGDESLDSSPDASREPDSLWNEVVKTLADEDDEENADLAHAVGADSIEPLEDNEDDERPSE
jgi:hypothetical protein